MAHRCSSPQHDGHGFTLVELLVVLVILGLAGTAVVMTAPADGDRLSKEADTLAARLLRAREEAVLSGRGVQLRVDPDGYEFLQRDFENWEPLREGPFRSTRFSKGTQARIPRSGTEAHVSFGFDPIGGNEPQSIVLQRLQRSARVSIDAAGEVSVDVR